MAVSPMGQVIVDVGDQETIGFVEFEPAVIDKARQGIPIGIQRRFDMYPDVAATPTTKVIA